MAGEEPRQPRDLQGLLKFCWEATKGEDAPENSSMETMDEERRKWLEEALSGMTVDVVEQLANGIKILNSDSVDLEDKEETLDRLEDWLGNIDMAVNFHKIGGYTCLKSCFNSNHPSLRSGAAHLAAEISQNNLYCQERFIAEQFIQILIKQMDQDTDPTCRVKALYGISCICRDFPPGLAEFGRQDGWAALMRAVQTPDNPKLRTKACFFVAACLAADPQHLLANELVNVGLIYQLAGVLAAEPAPNLTHEHVLAALRALVTGADEAAARRDATAASLNLEQILRDKVAGCGEGEEYRECVDHCRELLELLFRESDTDQADR